jgi:hypothetical protein
MADIFNCAPHTPLVVLQPWNLFKPMLLKTTITFIFIFSFLFPGGNNFLLPFYRVDFVRFANKNMPSPTKIDSLSVRCTGKEIP